MKFSTCQFTDPGGRSPNEDSVDFFNNGDFYAWITADGLGGHINGEIASSEAVKALGKALSACEKMDQDFVEEAFKQMNTAVSELDGPLSTAVCAFSDGKKLWYGNSGDSRFFFIRNKEVILHSHDHSLAYIAYRTGAINYEDIPNNPGQSRLFHSLGNEPDFNGEFYDPVDLEAGDAFLLCSDGFWELIKDEEIIRTRNIAPTAQEWLSLMLEIVQQRLQKTSDNYSAVCAIVTED